MAKDRLEVIKEADITNNCPECFNQELKLTFYQKHIYGQFFHRTSDVVSHEIRCKKCNSIIYPAQWTEDIERVFEYYQKMAVVEKSSIKYTSSFYILVVVGLLLIALAGYFALMHFSA
ncbi:hypothetical protein [Spongiimicrobium salis]|uniref:hypothetical protein n=1 Tax=Spongiimicrobium salis TaxID=1667022 RepID=UPI00374D8FFE